MISPDHATLYEQSLLRCKKEGLTLTTKASRLLALHGAGPLLQHDTFELDRETSMLKMLNDLDLHTLPLNQQLEEENDEEFTADSFFNLYPELVRNNRPVESDDDEEEEDEEYHAKIQQPQAKSVSDTMQVPRVQKPQQQQQEQHHQQQQQQEQHHQQQHQQQPRNPYASIPAQRQQAPQARPRNPYDQSYRPPTAAVNTTTNSSWDAIQQNPFQSARSFHDAGGEEEQPGQYNSHNQSRYQPQQPPPPPAEPIQKKIPESLKRKFQPPKRNENPNKKLGSSGGGTTSRPTSRSSGESEEDDLPEALKGLDKELIEKIQNEILESGDTITFDDIAGLDDAKQTVQELVCWPMKRPDLFTGLRRGPNGLLLYGPPGTGKTLIGKAVAYESGATFFSISSSSLTSKWIGEGEKLVRTLFAVAAYREPAVVFIDEIDSLLTQRKADENEASRRIKTEFLVQLDGTGTSGQGRVLVIGATNRPHELDDAARRRFVKRLYIPLPETPDRLSLLQTLLEKNRHELSETDLNKLAVATRGFSGADLKALCVEAAMGPLRGLGIRALEVDVKDVPPIAYKHFKQALRGVNPSVSQDDLTVYLEWDKIYGSKRAAAQEGDDDDSDEE